MMKSAKEKPFDLGDILSITTGRLVSPRHMKGIYDILNFMTGESLFTHQIPRAAREAEPVLLKRHPQLADVEASDSVTDWAAWLNEQKAIHGDTLPVPVMSIAQHERIDPMSEAAEFFPPDRTVVVGLGS